MGRFVFLDRAGDLVTGKMTVAERAAKIVDLGIEIGELEARATLLREERARLLVEHNQSQTPAEDSPFSYGIFAPEDPTTGHRTQDDLLGR